ncbi:TrbI/VirB10 family protein [Sphingomonas sp.]|uniref:TrbI/VirB10 family protein n=1 Tax=Sphingomonas sp. TaxID=28214 RepID=UPI0025FFF56B|nr:TrbI/VirB10 family protein [Sphingomonas sp.]
MTDAQKPGGHRDPVPSVDDKSAAVETQPGGKKQDEQKSPPKMDAALANLRGQPAKVERFKRGAIIGASGGVALVIVGVVGIAFTHHAPSLVTTSDRSDVDTKGAGQTLANVPSSYDGVTPRLRAPLPGDLGKPILDHERGLDGMGSMTSSSQPLVDQAAETEHQRLMVEQMSARTSAVMITTQNGNRVAEATASAATAPAGASEPGKLAIDADHDPNAQQRKADFVGTSDRGGDVNPHALTALVSPYTLSAGSVIAASLITGLRSDLPGLVTAQVTERVYDSPTGQILLIPQGARLIGSYDSVVAFGQRRALVVWQRIVMPNGSSLTIDNVPATDASGYAGLADKVDFHTWSLLKGMVMSTILGVGSSLTFTGESDLVQAIRESTQQNVSRAGDQITSRNLQIQPTITIRPGAPVRLVIHRDLILAPWHD